MKRILSAAAALFLLAGTAQAQHSSQHAALGLKGGLNIYNINYDNGPTYDSKLGFHAGLLGHIHLAPQLALQPEVVYSSQGAKYTSGSTESKLNLGYINVPVLVQYMFDNGFRLQAGPQVGFLLNAKNEVGSVETDVKNQFKTVDFAVSAGLGYVHPPSGFGVDARYNLGLSDITEADNTKAQNRGFQVGVFYLLNHRR
jgi:hypothetical protein